MVELEKLYTVEQAADLLAVTPATIREWLKTGQLGGIKIKGRLWRIRPSDIEAFLYPGVDQKSI